LASEPGGSSFSFVCARRVSRTRRPLRSPLSDDHCTRGSVSGPYGGQGRMGTALGDRPRYWAGKTGLPELTAASRGGTVEIRSASERTDPVKTGRRYPLDGVRHRRAVIRRVVFSICRGCAIWRVLIA
jgi:hypothetical protein